MTQSAGAFCELNLPSSSVRTGISPSLQVAGALKVREEQLGVSGLGWQSPDQNSGLLPLSPPRYIPPELAAPGDTGALLDCWGASLLSGSP